MLRGANEKKLMKKQTNSRKFVITLGVLALPFSASAAATMYGDLPSWSAAAGPFTTVTIPEPVGGAFDFFGTGDASVTYAGVTFSQSAALSANNSLFNVGSAFSGTPAVISSQQGDLANILITFPSAVTAFALNYGTFGGSGINFTLGNGDTFGLGSTAAYYDVPDFVGATDTTPFTTVLMTSVDGVFNGNQVSYSTSGAVPDSASSLTLLGLALGGMAALRRRLTLA